jgi:hypothetical protein
MITGILLQFVLFSIITHLSKTTTQDTNIRFTHPRCYTTTNRNIANKNVFSWAAVFQTMKYRLKFPHSLPVTSCVNKRLFYIAILLISISSDVETNPGPNYPCGTCGEEVLDRDPAVECDSCSMWFHISCQNLDPSWYQQLIDQESSFAWSCSNCEGLNHTHISSILSISSHNSFTTLQDVNPSHQCFPQACNACRARHAFFDLDTLPTCLRRRCPRRHAFYVILSESDFDSELVIVIGTHEPVSHAGV